MKQKRENVIRPRLYRQLTRKEPIQSAEKTISSNWHWENWTTPGKRMKPDCFLTAQTKINTKWIKDLNIRPETIKLLE